MELKFFQLEAINHLLEAMDGGKRDIILKSPTGSGKTIILTSFMNQYIKENRNIVFVWFTPGAGDLEEQSKKKMDLYIRGAQTKLLGDVMLSGFEAGDCCFINWEKLTKTKNTALKESERTNFYEWIEKALENGLTFKIIIDESHQNFTAKADAVVQLFKTNKIIRCSATPKEDKNARLIEITEREVISEGLIKKLLIINKNFPRKIEAEDETHYLLDKGLETLTELKGEFTKLDRKVNPLMVVQLPNSNDSLRDKVVQYCEKEGITLASGQLAIWLSDWHQNLEKIEEIDAPQKVVIIKQAIATGWDCPRAHILVKLREGMDETFEIQTIGRIRRMPEAFHYGNEKLDCCYLYTFDSKFTEGVKSSLGNSAVQVQTLFLKNEFKDFTLKKEQRTDIDTKGDAKAAFTAIRQYLIDEYGLEKDPSINKLRMEGKGFRFADKIERNTFSGVAETVAEMSPQYLSKVIFSQEISTHYHGHEFFNRVGRIGKEINFDYAQTNTILGKLFANEKKFIDKGKLLELTIKEWYAFVINNFDLLRHVFREAMAGQYNLSLKLKSVKEIDFKIPQSTMFAYDSTEKIQNEYKKNVYQGYLSSSALRSRPEKLFEKFCEESSKVDWWYKNGDKGDDYFSIAYVDNSNHQKLFYPDYILSIEGEVYIIETKGGEDLYGNSEDIDIYSAKKAEALEVYLKNHHLKGGFVRFDEGSLELFICLGKYEDDMNSDVWCRLKNL